MREAEVSTLHLLDGNNLCIQPTLRFALTVRSRVYQMLLDGWIVKDRVGYIERPAPVFVGDGPVIAGVDSWVVYLVICH